MYVLPLDESRVKAWGIIAGGPAFYLFASEF
jgi:hypothetical protein